MSSGSLPSAAFSPPFSTATPVTSTVIQQFLATNSPVPTPCNRVVVQLTTTLVIPDYNRYYNTPIHEFQPVYSTLGDGSLITQPFTDDLLQSNVNIFLMGILAMLFLRNVFVSGDYIRRAKLKKKGLFYLLFNSQMLAFPALIPIVASHFNRTIDCSSAIKVSMVSIIVSLHILITWILGYKAYKCLKDSMVVVLTLGFFLCASTAVAVLEVNGITAERRLTGGCIRTSNLRWISVYVVIQLAESFFICACFLFAVKRSHQSPSGSGRLSLQSSLNRTYNPTYPPSPSDEKHGRWWERATSSPRTREKLLFGNIFSKLRRVGSDKPHSPPPEQSQTPTSAPTSLTASPSNRLSTNPSTGISFAAATGRASPVPSALSRLIPRMELFRQVLKDELYYTTFITATCVVVAIGALFGLNFKNTIPVILWLSATWAVVSVLAISSFGRVIRRQERDAVLQEPGTWQRDNGIPAMRSRSRHGYSSSMSTVSQRRPWTNVSARDDPSNPFSDTRALNDHRASWRSDTSAGIISIPDAPSVLYRSSFASSPSPTSGRSKPLIAYDNLDGKSIGYN